MRKSTLGVRRAIIERARRRGYHQAVADMASAVKEYVPYRVFRLLTKWAGNVAKWHGQIYTTSDEAAEHEAAPALTFTRRPDASADSTFTH